MEGAWKGHGRGMEGAWKGIHGERRIFVHTHDLHTLCIFSVYIEIGTIFTHREHETPRVTRSIIN
jgi:hypothetical protein